MFMKMNAISVMLKRWTTWMRIGAAKLTNLGAAEILIATRGKTTRTNGHGASAIRATVYPNG
jgi:hypothetical protein